MAKCAENRSNLELGDVVRAKRHRHRSGFNTKIERLGAKSPSIGGGIVKYKHKKKEMTTVRKPERNETSGDRGGREKTKRTYKREGEEHLKTPQVRDGPGSIDIPEWGKRRPGRQTDVLKYCVLPKIIQTALPPRVVSRHEVGHAKLMEVRNRDKRWPEKQTKSGGITRDTTILESNTNLITVVG